MLKLCNFSITPSSFRTDEERKIFQIHFRNLCEIFAFIISSMEDENMLIFFSKRGHFFCFEPNAWHPVATTLLECLAGDIHETSDFPLIDHELLTPIRWEKNKFTNAHFDSFLDNILDFLVFIGDGLIEIDMLYGIGGIFGGGNMIERDVLFGDGTYLIEIVFPIPIKKNNFISWSISENSRDLMDEVFFGDSEGGTEGNMIEKKALHN